MVHQIALPMHGQVVAQAGRMLPEFLAPPHAALVDIAPSFRQLSYRYSLCKSKE
jgi:hypothetical protein